MSGARIPICKWRKQFVIYYAKFCVLSSHLSILQEQKSSIRPSNHGALPLILKYRIQHKEPMKIIKILERRDFLLPNQLAKLGWRLIDFFRIISQVPSKLVFIVSMLWSSEGRIRWINYGSTKLKTKQSNDTWGEKQCRPIVMNIAFRGVGMQRSEAKSRSIVSRIQS